MADASPRRAWTTLTEARRSNQRAGEVVPQVVRRRPFGHTRVEARHLPDHRKRMLLDRAASLVGEDHAKLSMCFPSAEVGSEAVDSDLRQRDDALGRLRL